MSRLASTRALRRSPGEGNAWAVSPTVNRAVNLCCLSHVVQMNQDLRTWAGTAKLSSSIDV